MGWAGFYEGYMDGPVAVHLQLLYYVFFISSVCQMWPAVTLVMWQIWGICRADLCRWQHDVHVAVFVF